MKLKKNNEKVLQKFMTVGGKHPHCGAKHPVKKQKAEKTLHCIRNILGKTTVMGRNPIKCQHGQKQTNTDHLLLGWEH